jgi:hypothetical protein
MQLLTTEQLGTGISRDIRVAPGARGTDHCFGIPIPVLGMHTQGTDEALTQDLCCAQGMSFSGLSPALRECRSTPLAD